MRKVHRSLKGARRTFIEGANAPYGHKVRQPLKGLTPLTKIGFANTSIPTPFPNKKTNFP